MLGPQKLPKPSRLPRSSKRLPDLSPCFEIGSWHLKVQMPLWALLHLRFFSSHMVDNGLLFFELALPRVINNLSQACPIVLSRSTWGDSSTYTTAHAACCVSHPHHVAHGVCDVVAVDGMGVPCLGVLLTRIVMQVVAIHRTMLRDLYIESGVDRLVEYVKLQCDALLQNCIGTSRCSDETLRTMSMATMLHVLNCI